MTLNFRKSLALILIWVLCAAFLCGCGSEAAENSGEILWVLTEQSSSEGMLLQAKIIAQRMEQAHAGLTVWLDVLPLEEDQRELRFQQLRTQIMAGKGPDVYLLTTGDSLVVDRSEGSYKWQYRTHADPLFRDIGQAMRNGLFADIEAYYSTDETLNPDSLRPDIMAAGTVEGKRYVLPLRFSVPLVATIPEGWAEYNIDPELLESGVTGLAAEALSYKIPNMAVGLLLPGDLTVFSQPFDYENKRLQVTPGEIADYMRVYQGWKAAVFGPMKAILQEYNDVTLDLSMESGEWYGSREALDAFEKELGYYDFNDPDHLNRILDYVRTNLYWYRMGLPLFTTNLVGIMQTLAVAADMGDEVKIYPLRATDGAVTADITYYGAVGSNCKNPAIAYDFLSQFLAEEFQWDNYRPRIREKIVGTPFEKYPVTRKTVDVNWPVRTVGSVPYMWKSLKFQYGGVKDSFVDGSVATGVRIQQVDLTDEDIPILSGPIDEVRFPVTLPEEESFEHALSLLNEEDGTPTDVDIDALAQKVYQSLWFHLMEG